MLGMLSTGFGFSGLLVPRSGSVILSPETYFARGTRGTRTDVVTLYDPANSARPVKSRSRRSAHERHADALRERADATTTVS